MNNFLPLVITEILLLNIDQKNDDAKYRVVAKFYMHFIKRLYLQGRQKLILRPK